jgi:16S rRNA (guanine1516-N2)-methyltransferase
MKKMDDDLDEVATRTRFVLSPRRGCGLLRFEQRREGLTVLPDDGKAFGAITVDLSSASILRRVQQGRGGLLAKAVLPAVGQPMPLVWDVTGGLGRDAMTLALLGCEVVAFERNPFVGMLLLDARSRALKGDRQIAEAASRLTIRIGDARTAMRADESNSTAPGSGRPDVIYIDPMFPEGNGKSSGKKQGNGKAAVKKAAVKKAAVKKDAMLLRMLVGEGADPLQDEELFTLSMQVAKSRVVVKRSLRAPAIVESPPPQASFKGKSVRVDRYRC